MRADGVTFYLDWSVAPWTDTDGQVGGIIIHTEDVTARVLTTQALERSETRLAEAQAIAGLGSCEWDLGSGRMTWSAETFRLLAYVPATTPPSCEAFFARVHAADRPALEAAMHATLEAGGPLTPESHGMVADIQAGARRLEVLLNDLIDFTRAEGGALALDRHVLDLRDLVGQVAKGFEEQAAQAGVAIDLALPRRT